MEPLSMTSICISSCGVCSAKLCRQASVSFHWFRTGMMMDTVGVIFVPNYASEQRTAVGRRSLALSCELFAGFRPKGRFSEPYSDAVDGLEIETQSLAAFEFMYRLSAALPVSVIVNLDAGPGREGGIKILQNVACGFIPVPIHVQ